MRCSALVLAAGVALLLTAAPTQAQTLRDAVEKAWAKGIKLAPGSKVVAAATTADKKTFSVRFTMK